MDIPGMSVTSGLGLGPHSTWLLDPDKAQFKMMLLDLTADDAGSADSNVLRSGLVLGLITATKKVIQYAAGAGNGSEVAIGILDGHVRLVDAFGNAITTGNVFVRVCIRGRVRASLLYGYDAAAGVELKAQGFLIEDSFE